MDIAAFIARRWAGSSPLKHTRRILNMGVGSMGLCITVMIVSICILTGFKQEIKEKVFGFGSHLVIQPYWTQSSDSSLCIVWNDELRNLLQAQPDLRSATPYALKGALVKGEKESHGVFFKGLSCGYDSSFFLQKLKKGRLPAFSSNGDSQYASAQILVSEILARKLQLDTGDRLRAFFVDKEQLRPRAFTICGIYASGLEKFDETYIFCDISQIRKINGWTPQQADGIDIRLKNPENREKTAIALSQALPYEYSCFPCDYLFPEIFDWLTLIDANVWVLMIIMLIVCMICLVAILFILIIERKPHIGVLRAIGADKRLTRRVFIFQTLFILGRSLLAGNLLALALCLIQKYGHIIKLNESVYYLDSVPVDFPWLIILSINFLVVLIAYMLLDMSSRITSRLSPASMQR